MVVFDQQRLLGFADFLSLAPGPREIDEVLAPLRQIAPITAAAAYARQAAAHLPSRLLAYQRRMDPAHRLRWHRLPRRA